MVLHEMEHLRRRDDWTNLLQKLALVVFPLHPVLLWVERRLCLERELACDDCVLQSTRSQAGAAKAYATCLTNLAEQSMLRRGISLALGALGSWERQSELARRVHRILRAPESRMSAGSLRWATAAMLLGLVGGGIELAHAPELVSFAAWPRVASTQAASLEAPGSAAAWTYEAARGSRHASPASATLVKAVMPAASHPASPAVSRPRFAARRAAGKQRAAEQQPRLMMTGWRESESQGRLILTVHEGSRVSYTVVPALERLPAYAAVPVPNGWIIFQL